MAAPNSYTPNLGRVVTEFIKPKRDVNTVFIHCTATDNPTFDAKACHNLHVDSNGWSAIGYHMIITSDGYKDGVQIQYGRDLERTPASQSGYNEGTIAISLNGLTLSKFGPNQLDQLRWICGEINSAYGGRMEFRGHREVSAKECPVIDYRKELGLDSAGFMTGAAAPGEPPKSHIPMVDIMVAAAQIGLHDHHPHVIVLRALLVRYGASKDALFPIRDKEYLMKFDDIVNDATKGFQREQGLVDDGIVGRSTWERLLDVGDD
jgi:hypothetical protein